MEDDKHWSIDDEFFYGLGSVFLSIYVAYFVMVVAYVPLSGFGAMEVSDSDSSLVLLLGCSIGAIVLVVRERIMQVSPLRSKPAGITTLLGWSSVVGLFVGVLVHNNPGLVQWDSNAAAGLVLGLLAWCFAFLLLLYLQVRSFTNHRPR